MNVFQTKHKAVRAIQIEVATSNLLQQVTYSRTN